MQTLDLTRHRQLAAQASALRFQGRVVQVVGLSIEVEGLQVPLGEICHLYPERARPSGPRSCSMNSWTSRPRSPMSAMTLTSASQLRAIMPSNVLLPTPEPAMMATR